MEKLLRWKECTETKGLKINISKTRLMFSWKNCIDVRRTGKWQCAVCGKNVISKWVKCRGCGHGEWIHKCCSCMKCSPSTTGDAVCVQGV